MLINSALNYVQKMFKTIYEKSFILQNIDWLIFVNIIFLIFTSIFAQSDNIGYFAIFVIILTVIKLLTKSGERFELSTSDKFLLIFFIFTIISVAGSTLFYLSLKGFFKTLTYLCFYISIVHFLKDNKDKIQYLFIAFVLCVIYETVFAFLQNIGAVAEISGWQDVSHLNPEEVMTRVYGTLKPYNPNLFGGYMLSVIPSFLVIPFVNFTTKSKNFNLKNMLIIISVFFGLASMVAIILTGCRGAYIGLFFQLITFIVIIYKHTKPYLRKIFTTFLAFIIMLISLFIISTASLRARICSIFAMRNDSSNSFRFNVYHSCIEMFKDNWLLGIGCGNQNFREIYGLYMRTGFDALSAYNIYLETAVESGIFAALSFIGFVLSVIYKSIKYIFSTKQQETIYVIISLLSIIGVLIHGFVDTVFFRPQIQFTFWIMVGIIRVLVK